MWSFVTTLLRSVSAIGTATSGWWPGLALAVILFALPAAATPAPLRVVLDDNYPPYVFRDSEGALQGILVDQWRLWEKKTGTPVELTAVDWNEALQRMKAGEFDVIDTIFETPERDQWLDFTPPYVRIEVPIFFGKDISGIADLNSLPGFAVAAKRGDAAVGLLKQHGVKSLLLFNNYEHLILAAQAHKVNVFVVDAPPALYFLNQLGIENEFRHSAPVNVGAFHRAVKKGDAATLAEVQAGFNRISPVELAALNEKWLGEPMSDRPELKSLGYAALGITGLILLLAGWNWTLNRQVRSRTADLRRSEKALQVSQAEIQRVLNNTREVIFQIDLSGQYIFGNAAAERLTGYPTSQLLQMSIWQLVPPEYHSLLKERLQRRSTDEPVGQTFEFEIIHRDGRRIWVELTTTGVLDKNQELAAVQGVARDITERRRAEEELKLVNFALNHVKEEVFLIDEQARVLYVNDEAVRLLGYSREELLKLRVPDFDPDFPMDRWQTHWQELQSLGSLSFESRHRAKSGRIFPVAIMANYFSRGGQSYNLALVRDITERQKSEQAVVESERRMRELFELSPDAILVANLDGCVVDANAAACKLHGIEHDQLVGMPLLNLVPSEQRSAMSSELAKIAPKEVRSLEGVSLAADGRTVPVEVRASRITYADQPAWLINLRDISERKQLEDQLRQSQKMEAIGQLSGGIAHDFNNILAVIQMHCSLFKMEPDLTAPQIEFAAEIEKSVRRAADLTRQLLLFSRKQALQARDLDLNDAIANTAKMLQRIVGEDILMELKLQPCPLPIHADGSMLDQVLLNLTVNARDAMPSGGRLGIETTEVEFSELNARQCPGARPGKFACVTVSDTGHGIPPEILPRIFEPFFTTKDIGKGTGLGLSVAHGIVQQHHGWINVQSQMGHGTIFSIYLPLSAVGGGTHSDTQHLTMPRGNETLLLVEDDLALRQSIHRVLTKLGYDVIEAESGTEAQEKWASRRENIKLLLTDLVMPHGINGRELGQQLLQDQPHLKVIYISGYSKDLGDLNLKPEAGIDFLAKPFFVHQLARKVRSCLDSN